MSSSAFDETYYRDVCGQRQTRFDRGRDDRVVGLVRRYAPPRRSDSTLLDIGCGYGHLLRRFARRYRLAGIDVSAHAAGVRSIRDALVPGGICVIHLPTINGSISRLIYRFAYAKDPTHVYRPSGRDALRLFASNGFRVLEWSFAPHVPALGSRLGWHPALLAVFARR